jgi:hypothetical protein
MMPIILTGFTQERGFRVFAFARTGTDEMQADYTVRADLSLIRRYDIRLQELPLLCRNLLERRADQDKTHTLTFTEEDMRLYANDCAATRSAAAARKRTPPRRPTAATPGSGWRSSHS